MRYALHRGFRKIEETLRNRSLALLLLAGAALVVFFQYITSLNMFVIFDEDTLTVHQSYTTDAEKALAEAGIRISHNDLVFLPNADGGNVVEIHIERSKNVFLDIFGEQRRLSTLGETVGDVLTRAGITPGSRDEVEPELSTPVTEGMAIAVWHRETRVDVITEKIPFQTERVPLDTLLEGNEEVVQEGSAGEKAYIYEVSIRNGTKTDSRLIDTTITVPAQNTIIQYGTKKPPPPPPPPPSPPPPSPPPSEKPKEVTQPPKEYSDVAGENETGASTEGDTGSGGVLVTSSGEELRYKKKINVTATAYTTERQRNKRTYMGTIARFGAIAVDPKVIPLGTRVYVEIPGGGWTYGLATCEDTGGSIKGNKVDLFFDTWDTCIRFGVRKAIVYILE